MNRSTSSDEKRIVLIIDDTPLNLSLMSGLLKDDYQVKVANNGERGIRIARSNTPPDLILLDIMMPEMDGYEVCRQLKADPLTRDIPVIFLTAKTETEDEVQGLSLGAVDYLTKPIVPSIVKARISTHLALRKARHELEKKNLILNDEKELLEEIVTRMRSACQFDDHRIRYIQKSLEKTCGDIILSACRPNRAQHVLVGDFSGHGLPAALGGPLVAYMFYRLTGEGRDLQYILAEVNRTLYRQLPTQLYMAASALELTPERNKARIWNYGVPPVLVLRDAHGLLRVKSSGLPLGLSESTDSFDPHAQLEIQSSMRIYQYSDGITEAISSAQELFGLQRLEELIFRICRERLPLELVWDELDRYCGAEGLTDDAVMVETSADI